MELDSSLLPVMGYLEKAPPSHWLMGGTKDSAAAAQLSSMDLTQLSGPTFLKALPLACILGAEFRIVCVSLPQPMMAELS